MWQAEAVKELTLSASPATAVGEQTLTLANRRYSTVYQNLKLIMNLPPFNPSAFFGNFHQFSFVQLLYLEKCLLSNCILIVKRDGILTKVMALLHEREVSERIRRLSSIESTNK